MIEKININGVEYAVTPVTEGEAANGVTVKVDGVTYLLGEPIVAPAVAPAASSGSQAIEKVQVNGVVYDIADVEGVEAEIMRASEAEETLRTAIETNTTDLAETKKDIANQLFAASTADMVNITGRNEQSMRINFSANIPAATTEKAGVMTAGDKKKVNASIKDIVVNPNVDDVELDLEDNTEKTSHVVFPAATPEKAGVMSAEDKRTLHNIDLRLGFNNETIVFKAGDLLPMTWNGTKMVSSTNYNIWIMPLNEGREYKSVFLSFLNSRRTCSEYPVLDKELAMSNVSDSFKATSEMKYLVITVTMSDYDGSDYEISASGHGLLENFENLVPLVNDTNNLAADTQKLMSLHIKEVYACIGSKDRSIVLSSDNYDNIVWNGTKFVSATSSKYNGFVVPIYPGERIIYQVDNYANNLRTTTEYPVVGSSDFVRTRSELGDEFIVQENEHYLFINNYIPEFTGYKVICGIGSINSQLDDFKQSQYPLYGKTIVCFGDSLTEGNGDDGKGYADYLAELTQANIIRGGVGGTQLATRKAVVETPADYLEAYGAVDISNLVKAWANKDWTAVDNAVTWLAENKSDNNNAQIERLKANPIENTDIVIVFGGSNDCANGTFGAPNDTNPVMNTCGGINQIIDSILSVKPDMPIYFFTPIPRMVIDTWCDDYRTDQSDVHGSLSFPSLVKRIKECVEHNHIPCCDMYNTIGINRKNIYTYADDGVHPNHGYSMLANKMYSFIMANRNWR